MSYFFALVVNPRDGELIQVLQSSTSNQGIQICDARGLVVGRGYFGGRDEYATCEDPTGFPRTHTPKGVTRRGTGLGTCLYTGLVAAARHNQMDDGSWLEIEVNETGEGINSNENRSDAATEWWDAAVSRYKLARRTEIDSECDDDCNKIEHFCDSYSYRSAIKNHLIVAFEQVDDLPEQEQLDDRAESVYELPPRGLWLADEEALAGVNFGLLRSYIGENLPERDAGKLAAALIGLAMKAKMPTATIDRMIRQYREGFDEEIVPDPVEEAYAYIRKNPRTAMNKKLKSVPKKYPTPRRANPAVSKEQIEADVKALREQRAKNGWDKFSSDPSAP